jgi:hypothetical protein
MILNVSAHAWVFGFENKHNKQSLKIYPGTFGTKNELYGFIILHKIINVKIYIMDYVIWSNDWFFIVY